MAVEAMVVACDESDGGRGYNGRTTCVQRDAVVVSSVDGWVRRRAVVAGGKGEDVLAEVNGDAVMVGMVAW